MDYLLKILLYFSLLFFPWLLYQLFKITRKFINKEKDILKLEEEYSRLVNSRKEYIY